MNRAAAIWSRKGSRLSPYRPERDQLVPLGTVTKGQ